MRCPPLQRAVPFDRRDIRRCSKARLPAQGNDAIGQVEHRPAELVAQRIVVDVDFEPAIAAGAREQMRGGQQADAAAEIMRTKGLAGFDDVARQPAAADGLRGDRERVRHRLREWPYAW